MDSRRTESGRLRVKCLLILTIVAVGGLGAIVIENAPPPEYELVSGSANIFPSFAAMPDAYVVEVPSVAGQGEMLSLSSLQGLVNRHGAQIFLDAGGMANTSFLLPFIEGRYPVNLSRITSADFLANFSSFATGLVVYDPSRPDTVNVATVIAGLEDCVVVDPEIRDYISQLTSLQVKVDLREPPWAGLDSLQLYRKSFNDLYPKTSGNLLAILAPDKLGVRDYVVAAKVWTFYARQGPFTSQENIDFTEDVLSSTPHNIPVLGWFETPNIVEENFFVQAASRHGKSIVGGHNVPNISFLAGLQPPQPLSQKRLIPPPPNLADDGIYVSFAIPDGDNLDFLTSKMLEIWNDQTRGTVPLAWSVSPLLAELAPPLLDFFYRDASAVDSFVAAPSGAGYAYPGYMQEADLEQYLIRTREVMAASDLDVVWLLNSFKAYEIPYSPETLEAYVNTLSPRGLLLDYADQAVTRDVWMQDGRNAAAPVIRSTHLWSGRDNLVGKVMVDIDASPSKPHFFLVTVYPWSLQLGDAVKTIDSLRERYGDRVRSVSIETLLHLVAKGFHRIAEDAVGQARSNPFAAFDPWDIDSAIGLLDQAAREESSGNTSLAGFHAYRALEHARRAVAVGAVTVLVLIIASIIGGVLSFLRLRTRAKSTLLSDNHAMIPRAFGTILLFFLFFSGLERALDYNFWTYASVFVAGIVVLFTPRLQSLTQKMLGNHAWPGEMALMAISGLLLLFEPWAFVPYSLACAMLLFRFLNHGEARREREVLLFGIGVVGSALFRFDPASLVLSVALLLGLGYILDPKAPVYKNPEKSKGSASGVTFAATVLALQVVWLALFQNRYFTEKAGGGIDLLLCLAILALSAAPIVALAVWNMTGSARRIDGLLVLGASTVLWIALWFSQNIVLLSLLVFFIAVLISWSYLSAATRVTWDDRNMMKFVSQLLILGMVVVILLRMPAIVYSLYIAKLPLPVEYILYTPTLLMIFATLDIVQTEALVRFARKASRRPKRDK